MSIMRIPLPSLRPRPGGRFDLDTHLTPLISAVVAGLGLFDLVNQRIVTG